jgi:hypothetical protein
MCRQAGDVLLTDSLDMVILSVELMRLHRETHWMRGRVFPTCELFTHLLSNGYDRVMGLWFPLNE